MNGPFYRHLRLLATQKVTLLTSSCSPPHLCVFVNFSRTPRCQTQLRSHYTHHCTPPDRLMFWVFDFLFSKLKGSNYFFGIFGSDRERKIGPNFQFSSDIFCCCELYCNILLYCKSLPTIIGPKRGSAFRTRCWRTGLSRRRFSRQRRDRPSSTHRRVPHGTPLGV